MKQQALKPFVVTLLCPTMRTLTQTEWTGFKLIRIACFIEQATTAQQSLMDQAHAQVTTLASSQTIILFVNIM